MRRARLTADGWNERVQPPHKALLVLFWVSISAGLAAGIFAGVCRFAPMSFLDLLAWVFRHLLWPAFVIGFCPHVLFVVHWHLRKQVLSKRESLRAILLAVVSSTLLALALASFGIDGAGGAGMAGAVSGRAYPTAMLAGFVAAMSAVKGAAWRLVDKAISI